MDPKRKENSQIPVPADTQVNDSAYSFLYQLPYAEELILKTQRHGWDRLTWPQALIIGGVAGGFFRLSSVPLTSRISLVAASSIKSLAPNDSFRLQRIVLQELRDLEQDFSKKFIRNVSFFAIQLGVYSKLRGKWNDTVDGRLKFGDAFLAGALSGAASNLAVYFLPPKKLQSLTKRGRGKYVFPPLKTLVTTTFASMPYVGFSYAFFEYFNNQWKDFSFATPYLNIPSVYAIASLPVTFLNGYVSATISKLISVPFDMARKSAAKNMAKPPKIDYAAIELEMRRQTLYLNNVMSDNWRTNLMGVRSIRAMSITLMAYEFLTRITLYWNGYTISPWVDIPKAQVDQSMRPHQLKQWKRDEKIRETT